MDPLKWLVLIAAVAVLSGLLFWGGDEDGNRRGKFDLSRWRKAKAPAFKENRQYYGNRLVCERCRYSHESWLWWACTLGKGRRFHGDHIVAKAVDWSRAYDPDNVAVLCDSCNLSKATKRDPNWKKLRGPLRPIAWVCIIFQEVTGIR